MSGKRESDDQDFDAQRFESSELERYMPGFESEMDPSRLEDDVKGQSPRREFCSGSIDSTIWERLIDSQLPDAQYEELLVSMEQQPQLWRDCAMAFLERQAWTDAMSEMGLKSEADPKPWNFGWMTTAGPKEISSTNVVSTPRPENPQNISESIRNEKNATPATVTENRVANLPKSSSRNWLKSLVVWIPSTIAAIVLLGFSINEFRQPAKAIDSAESVPSVSLAEFSGDPAERYVKTFNQMNDNDKNRVLSNQPVSGVSPTLPTTPAIFRERHVEATRQFVILSDRTGKRYVVPVDSFRPQRLNVQ